MWKLFCMQIIVGSMILISNIYKICTHFIFLVILPNIKIYLKNYIRLLYIQFLIYGSNVHWEQLAWEQKKLGANKMNWEHIEWAQENGSCKNGSIWNGSCKNGIRGGHPEFVLFVILRFRLVYLAVRGTWAMVGYKLSHEQNNNRFHIFFLHFSRDRQTWIYLHIYFFYFNNI